MIRPARTDFIRADARRLPYPDQWFHACATSPPYYGLRMYGDGSDGKWLGGDPDCDHKPSANRGDRDKGGLLGGTKTIDAGTVWPAGVCGKCGAQWKGLQLGQEQSPDEFVASLVSVFNEVGRVLRPDGTLWVNLGDTYSHGVVGRHRNCDNPSFYRPYHDNIASQGRKVDTGVRDKELIGVPWMFAFAMRRAGWLLRQEIIWAKGISFCPTYVGSAMPNSVRDRCTTSHEHVFLFTRQPDYFCDMDAIAHRVDDAPREVLAKRRNARSVWTINTKPYKGSSHFATWPERLVRQFILAGTSGGGCCRQCGGPLLPIVERVKLTRERPNVLTKRRGQAGTGNYAPNTTDGTATRLDGWEYSCACNAGEPVRCRVLDCFGGVATTAIAANRLGRDCTIVDLMHDYLVEGRGRLATELKTEFKTDIVVAKPSRKRVQVDPNQPSLFEAIA